jgi:hypothetical protein
MATRTTQTSTQPRRQLRPHVYPVRLSDAERDALAEKAEAEGLDIADIIRRTLRAAVQTPAQTGR